MKKKKTIKNILAHTVLTLLAIVWVSPLVWIILTSFRAQKGAYTSSFFPKSYSLDNYIKLFTDPKGSSKTEHPAQRRNLYSVFRSELRDSGGDQSFSRNGGGCCRHEYRVRSHGSQPYGNEGMRNLLHHKYGSRNPRSAPGPQRGAGGR